MDATKIVELAVGVLLIIVVISVAFQLKESGVSFAKSFSSDLNRTTTSIEESKFTKYETTGLSGADVVNAIKQFSGELIVSVNTYKDSNTQTEFKYSKTGGDSFETDYTATPADTSGRYINPNAKFTGKVDRTNSGIIKGLVFIQDAWVDSALAFEQTPIIPGGNPGGGGGAGNGGGSGESGNVSSDVSAQISGLENTVTGLTNSVQLLSESIATLISSGGGTGNGSTGNGSGNTPSIGGDDYTQQFAAIQNKLDDLATQVGNLESAITGISGGSGGGGGASDTGNSDISDIKSQIAGLDNTVTEKFTDLSSLITELQTAVGNTNTQLGKLQAEIGEGGESVKGELQDRKDEIAALQSQCSDIQDALLDIQDTLNRAGLGATDTETGTADLEAGTHY